MPYITLKQNPMVHNITIDDLICGDPQRKDYYYANDTNTVTRFYETVPADLARQFDPIALIGVLHTFNERYAALRAADRNTQYRQYRIPKRSGGFRTISDPIPELKEAQRQLVTIFEQSFAALYHTAAFAYVKGRCAHDAVKRHQQNQSYWFCDLDFHDFFGSTTKEFMLSMMSEVFPFSIVLSYEDGKRELSDALELCFLDGGLPQGSVASPMLTNIMMIPIDVHFCNHMQLIPFGRTDPERDPDEPVRYVYTRYADDICVSSRAAFDYKKLEAEMREYLASKNAPFSFNAKKTHYGNRAGSNFRLGVIINKDNEISVGWRNLDQLRHDLNEYLYDRMRGVQWDYVKLTRLYGIIQYYRQIDPERTNHVVAKYGSKYRVNVDWLIKQDIKHAH